MDKTQRLKIEAEVCDAINVLYNTDATNKKLSFKQPRHSTRIRHI